MNTEQILSFTRLTETAKLPVYGSDQAACFDLFSDIDVTLYPGYFAMIPTALVMHIADGYQVKINPRSGLAAKHGVTVLNAPGTIDSDYTGEIKVILINHGERPFRINRGDRIVQGEIMPAYRVDLDSLGQRKGGFGSSGVK